jgi:hypothetical protein
MSESTGQTGRGIFIQVADAQSPETWTTIGNVTAITSNGVNAAEIDFTHLLSEGGFREFRQGFKDAGTIGVNMHLDPTDPSHAALLDDFVSGRIFDARVDFGGAGWDKYLIFRGFVQNPGDIEINVDNPVTNNATIRRTGPSTFVDKT